jgi:hypothetical protein
VTTEKPLELGEVAIILEKGLAKFGYESMKI